MEITKREIIFSTVIIAIMIGIGIPIGNAITGKVLNNAMKVTSSTKVTDPEKFSYIERTNVGDFLAEGKLIADDPVSIRDIPGNFLMIRKVKEVYTMHTRTVVVSNGKTTTTRIETYWTWDEKDRWNYSSNRVRFLSKTFNLSSIKYYSRLDYLKTINESSHVRYVYRVHPAVVEGVMTGVADNKSYNDLEFTRNATIDKIVDSAEKDINRAPIIFWVLWMILTAGLVVLFYYIENDWLED